MFFLRFRPLTLFILLFLPLLAAALLQVMAPFHPQSQMRMLIFSVNLSTLFALVFVCWIASLAYVLAPNFGLRFLVFAGLAASVLFRFWEDNWSIRVLHATGEMPKPEDLRISSLTFILHALVSLLVLVFLVLLPLWLVRKEKEQGLPAVSKAKTILWFFIFPIGLWFIQPRVQQLLEEED